MPDAERMCAKCLSWEPLEGNQEGHCRKNAPRPRVDGARNVFWPLTLYDDWCGQWQPKAQKQQTECRNCTNLLAQIQGLANRLAAHGEKP